MEENTEEMEELEPDDEDDGEDEDEEYPVDDLMDDAFGVGQFYGCVG